MTLSPPFKSGTSMQDATQKQVDFMDSELPRSRDGAADGLPEYFNPETGQKQMATHYRPTPMDKYCKDHKLTYETLKHLKNLTRAGN
jgi:hypothetical protein